MIYRINWLFVSAWNVKTGKVRVLEQYKTPFMDKVHEYEAKGLTILKATKFDNEGNPIEYLMGKVKHDA